MKIIKTKRSKLRFYLIISILTVFYSGMGLMMLLMFSDLANSGKTLVSKDYLLLVFGCFCLFMMIYNIVSYFKNSPTIVADDRQISFNDETFNWSEVIKIDLIGKRPFRYLISFPKEGAMLTFKDNSVKYFFDDMYSNSWQLKCFIEQVIINKQNTADITILKVDQNELLHESLEIFKGNQFTSSRGITLWGLVGFLIFLVLSMGTVPPWRATVFALLFISLWFIINSYLMHYFILSEKYFAVRNHNFIWKYKIYKVEDIKEIVFETAGRMPNCLRIITNDFRNKVYPAGTLRDKNWLDLKDKLELKNIIVRNECI